MPLIGSASNQWDDAYPYTESCHLTPYWPTLGMSLLFCRRYRACIDGSFCVHSYVITHVNTVSNMGSITIRINNELKEKSYAVLERLGVTPSEFIRQALEYVAEQQRTPFKIVVLTDEDEELLAIVRERLAKPSPKIRISLDDL